VRLLVVAATLPEIAPLLSVMAGAVEHGRMVSGSVGPHQVDVLTTGVGMVATSVWCSRALASGTSYDAALNLGVCGSFVPSLPPPTVVHVVSDCIPEQGAEDGSRFLPIAELGLLDPDAFPYVAGRLVGGSLPSLPLIASLPTASGITVNTVHGDESSIAAAVERWHPDVESMEGAAFMYACLAADVPFAQVRAVSNRVERRNRAAWDLPGAVRALGRAAVEMLESA
jgi:futalosine hydrolase